MNHDVLKLLELKYDLSSHIRTEHYFIEFEFDVHTVIMFVTSIKNEEILQITSDMAL